MKMNHSQQLGLGILMSLAPALSLAAGGHHDGVPWTTTAFQLFNVTVIVIILFKFLKTPIKTYFQNRRDSYLAAFEKAQAARTSAEAEKAEIKARLTKLQATTSESIDRAHAEASDLKRTLIQDAEASAQRISAETQETIRYEIEKAKKQIRDRLLSQSTARAQSELKALSGPEQSKLQESFMQQVRGAGQ